MVGADRCSFYRFEESSNELITDLFDEGKLDENGDPVFSKNTTIRFKYYNLIELISSKYLQIYLLSIKLLQLKF